MKDKNGVIDIQVGDRVSWLAEGATERGHGNVIQLMSNGVECLVACDGGTFENIPKAYHVVICCTATWLTVEE